MANLDTRIALQRSRFTLIQEATNLDDENAARSNRQLVNARLDMLEQNWNKFQEEHESLCLSVSESLSDNPYMRERVYERCQAFYAYARATLHTQLEEFD
ncbi:Gag-pol polyprotein [Camponotus japonicus]